MQVALEKIVVKPGQQLLLQNISWQDFEEILAELGEHRSSRIAYSNGVLEIMVPLPEHEKNKEIIGDLSLFHHFRRPRSLKTLHWDKLTELAMIFNSY